MIAADKLSVVLVDSLTVTLLPGPGSTLQTETDQQLWILKLKLLFIVES